MEPVRPELIARVGDETFDGKVVGEYATGTGYFTQLIAARAQRVVASGASPAMLQQLRRKHLANVATAVADVLDAWCPVRPASDGTGHVVVKYFRNAQELLAAMDEWGWAGTSVPIGAANGRGFYWCTASRKT
jgi:hypothetical protein